MPKISSFNTAKIDQRVQTANISSAGAGAVTKAISGLGAEGFAMATGILKQQKEDQADNYSRKERDKKEIARTNKVNELQSDLDASTGMLKSQPGKSYQQGIAEWEDQYDKSVLDNAPTDLAARKFRARDDSRRNRSLVAAEMFQISELHKHTVKDDKDSIKRASNKILGSDADMLESEGQTLLGLHQEAELDLKERIASGISKGIYTENQGRDLYENGMLSKTNAYFDANLLNGRLKESIVQLDAPVLFQDEDFKGQAKEVMSRIVGVKSEDIEKITPMGNGDYGIMIKGNPPKIVGIDPDTGDTYRVNDIQEVNLGDIPLGIEKKDDPKLDRFLTPADKKRHMLNILKKTEANTIANKARIKQDAKDLIAGLAKSGQGSIRFRGGIDNHEGTKLVKKVVSDIAKLKDEVTRENLLGGVVAAINVGEFTDENVWSTPSQSVKWTDRLKGKMKGSLKELGYEAQGPLEHNAIMSNAEVKLKGLAQGLAREKMNVNYIYKNDGALNKTHAKFEAAVERASSPDENIAKGAIAEATMLNRELQRGLKGRQDTLGLPEYMRETYKKEYLQELTSKFNEFLDPTKGYAGAVDASRLVTGLQKSLGNDYYKFMQELGMGGELKSQVTLMAMFDDSPEGIQSRAIFIKGLQNYPELVEKYERENKKPVSALAAEVNVKLQPYIANLLRTDPTSDKVSMTNTLVKAGTAEAIKNGGDVDKASARLMGKTYHMFNVGDSGYAVPSKYYKDNNISKKEMESLTGILQDIKKVPGVKEDGSNIDLSPFIRKDQQLSGNAGKMQRREIWEAMEKIHTIEGGNHRYIGRDSLGNQNVLRYITGEDVGVDSSNIPAALQKEVNDSNKFFWE